MVIASFGQDVSEAELRRLCDCTFDGTSALKAVDAARRLGFINTTKQTLTIEELEAVVVNGLFPIVFVDLTPIDGGYQAHAFVVTDMNQFSIKVLDPASGERLIPRDVFYLAWKLRRRLTILVEH
jgi:ABC-type bacteriocin/lantibiotic exporter with double-glycine peptidase domain